MFTSLSLFKNDLIESLPLIMNGLANTLLLAIVISILGLIGGIVVFYFEIRKHTIIKRFSDAYISFFIGTPLLVILFLIYYGLPQYGFGPSAFVVAVICFTFNISAYNAAYLSTAYRGLDKSELEAATAQGFSNFQVYRYIILPQTFSTSVPALTNQVIGNLKDTSIVFLIGYTDFFARMQELASSNFQFFYAYTFTAMVYVLLVSIIILIAHRMEKRLRIESVEDSLSNKAKMTF